MQFRVAALSLLALASAVTTPPAVAQSDFVNWENHPIHSLELLPNGRKLLVVNTPDNRLDVFGLLGAAPRYAGSIAVGLDPVSVRAWDDRFAWVVNHVSDSISVVDLLSLSVVSTLPTADEPYDVVFAGSPRRAFVSCSQANVVQVFDPMNLGAAPITLPILGEDPRALAVSPDGSEVYVAVFESGNGSTVLGGGAEVFTVISFPPNVVSHASGPYGGVNPPPNDGGAFFPPTNPSNTMLPVGLIVRKDEDDRWRDDNGGDWTDFVSGPQAALSGRRPGWDLPDRDVAIIDAQSLDVSYQTRLMNILMAAGVNPATGEVSVVGTDGINETRFEANVNGVFGRMLLATFDPAQPGPARIKDLNPHLDYLASSIPQTERDRAIGDPRAVVWNAAGTRAYVTGMGSNNVVVIDAAGDRAGLTETIEVGEGPIGLALDEPRGRAYVHNRFEGSISVIHLASETEIARVAMHDPTPEAIKVGRKHLYDTHETSGLGHLSCASCHVDARMDRLAWDLGDPPGETAPNNHQNRGAGIPGLRPGTANPGFQRFHPMKGPMTTQTLQDIIGHEPLHWRGDRDGLEDFNPAFEGLMGDDEQLSAAEMQEFEDFLATVAFPPNPFRRLDNSLPNDLPLPGHYTTGRFAPAGEPLPNGNAQNGLSLYVSLDRRLDRGAFACVTCHTLPTGMGPDMTFSGGQFQPIEPGPDGERHLMLVSVDGSTNRAIKVPHLRNVYEKTGCNFTQLESTAGFGMLHDGSVDSIERFVAEEAFGMESDQEIADMVAFMLAFAGDDLPDGNAANILNPPGPLGQHSHAAVGKQTTLYSFANAPQTQRDLIQLMITLAESGRTGLAIKGRVGGEPRGYMLLLPDVFQSDRADEMLTEAELLALATPATPLTFTVTPPDSAQRLGIDRDRDGYFDRDEHDACSDPANADIIPGGPGSGLLGDVNGDRRVGLADLATLLSNYGTASGATYEQGDLDEDGDVDDADLVQLLGSFGLSCG